MMKALFVIAFLFTKVTSADPARVAKILNKVYHTANMHGGLASEITPVAHVELDSTGGFRGYSGGFDPVSFLTKDGLRCEGAEYYYEDDYTGPNGKMKIETHCVRLERK